MRCPAATTKAVATAGTMAKKKAPRTTAETKAGRARRKRRLSSVRRPYLREPLTHRRKTTEIELPAWLPPAVASHARQINYQTASDELMLRRLTSDPRMERVWTELLKRERSDYKSSDRFKYPATHRMDWDPQSRNHLRRARTLRQMPSPQNEHEANKLEMYVKLHWAAKSAASESSELTMQERGLAAFFSQAFEIARTDAGPVTRAVAQQKRAHYLDMADRIRTDVGDLDSFLEKELIDAAFAYEALADRAAPPPGHPLRIQRRPRGDERQIAFVRQLADATKAIFGHSLHGTVATVANVAFGCAYWSDARVAKTARP
jgi:hypothetical protein